MNTSIALKKSRFHFFLDKNTLFFNLI